MLNAPRGLSRLFWGLAVCLLLHPSGVLAQNNATATQRESNTPKETDAPTKVEGMGLALKSILLQHGEHGLELWRLKAGWANMTKQDGVINLEQPVLTYFMSDKTELHVVADKGDIDQEKQILRFNGQVRATRANNTVTSDKLVYEGSQRTMTFPSGADFTGEGVRGSAERVIWHMNTRIIEAEGAVDVFLGDKRVPPAGGASPAP